MQTFTAAQIAAMPDAARIALFEELGAATYGTDRFHSRFARDSGWSRRTFYNWTNGIDSIPPVAILILQEWANRRTTPSGLIEAMNAMAAKIEKVAKECRETASTATLDLRASRKAVVAREIEEDPTLAERDAAGPAPEPAASGIDLSRL